MENDYLPVAEFAKRLHVGKTVIYGLITDGVITTINVGSAKRKRLRIPPSQFAVVEKRLAI